MSEQKPPRPPTSDPHLVHVACRPRETSTMDTCSTTPQVNRWYENVAMSSLITSQGWFRRMDFVSEQFKVTPAQIAKMDKKQASDFLLDIIGTPDRSRIDLARS